MNISFNKYFSMLGLAISNVIVVEEEGNHYPINYVNKIILDAEARYIMLEQLALAFVVST